MKGKFITTSLKLAVRSAKKVNNTGFYLQQQQAMQFRPIWEKATSENSVASATTGVHHSVSIA